ncbi:MAG TPA: hypothetical protein VIC85_19230 [Ktedonobacterales bacterium]|jgi:hypothetical protein
MSALARYVGQHRLAIVRMSEGRHAGRFSVAFEVYGQWRYLADDDTGELRSWKTEYEAAHIAEASRRTLGELMELAVTHATPRGHMAR